MWLVILYFLGFLEKINVAFKGEYKLKYIKTQVWNFNIQIFKI